MLLENMRILNIFMLITKKHKLDNK